MTQVVVNFLQPTTVGGTTLTQEGRIFDFEITSDAQSYYNYELSKILLGLGAQIKDSAGVLHAPTPTTLNAGTVVFTGPTDAVAVSNAINLLNNWSQMKLVNASGFQTYSFGNFGTTVTAEATVIGTGPSGVLQIPTGQTVLPRNALFPSDAAASGITSLFTATGTPPVIPGLTTTMDQYMAQGLDQLIRTLRAAGWDPIGSPVTSTASANLAAANLAITAITAATTTAIYGVAQILQRMASAAAQAHLFGKAALTDSMSIQQVLMVDYVSRGNEILFNEMNNLKIAIDVNQQALSYLNSLQDLMNQKDPEKFVLALQDLNNVSINTSSPQSQYDNFERDSYNQALDTMSRVGISTLATFYNRLAGASILPTSPIGLGAFDALSTAAHTVAAYSITQIKNNLEYLVSQIGGAGGPTGSGLVQAINQVKLDFQGITGTDALKTWIQDTQENDQGGFQRTLSNAIVSSQSFNDTQRENLREVMFVFEEFYKSATGLLSRLTQLIEKMADGIR